MRTTIWFIRFWAYIIGLIPKHNKVRKLEKQGNTEAHAEMTRRVVQKWARKMIENSGSKVTVSHLENMTAEPAVYVCNHIGHFDIPLCLGYLGDNAIPLVAKKEIKKLPMIRDWMADLRCVFIDRENPKESVRALNEATDWVRKGYSMVVFPEGTRSKDGEIDSFKYGAFRIAQKAGVPVVPVLLYGTNNIMPKDTLRIQPADIGLQVLTPIQTCDFTKEDWKALPKICEDVIRQEQLKRK